MTIGRVMIKYSLREITFSDFEKLEVQNGRMLITNGDRITDYPLSDALDSKGCLAISSPVPQGDDVKPGA